MDIPEPMPYQIAEGDDIVIAGYPARILSGEGNGHTKNSMNYMYS